MKGIEKVMEKISKERVFINDLKLGFIPRQGTTDAILFLRQLQEKHIANNRKWYFAFVDPKKAFKYQEKLFGEPCENLALRNGLCGLYRLCTTTPEVKLESITPDPFRRSSTRVRENAPVNTARRAMVRDVYFSFSKIL